LAAIEFKPSMRMFLLPARINLPDSGRSPPSPVADLVVNWGSRGNQAQGGA
jgi:hypothetical protein